MTVDVDRYVQGNGIESTTLVIIKGTPIAITHQFPEVIPDRKYYERPYQEGSAL